jgi:hypothetical protein
MSIGQRWPRTGRALLALVFVASGCAGGAEEYAPGGDDALEICGDLLDNDGDFAVDCDDIDCAGEPACVGRPDTEKDCVNSVDDDGDGKTDCADSDCAGAGACKDPEAEVCGDGADNDLNGLVDCADPVCKPLPECQDSPAEDCGNGVDDDRDGRTDCDDPDCDGDRDCDAPPTREDCANGVDDDADGKIDCDDTDCAAVCEGDAEDCGNGVDDDGDGQTDCADPDCGRDPRCSEPDAENCTDGRDNDGDGRTDCDDTDCSAHPSCVEPDPENCTDGVDNDGDGRTDCDDGDCSAHPSCQPDAEACDDGVDNDGDGDVDCDDGDCSDDPACEQGGGPGSCAEPLTGRVGIQTGDTTAGTDDASPSCALGEGGLDAVYRMTFDRATTVCASTAGTTFDTVLYVQTTCGSEGDELACNDDGEGLQSVIEFEAAAGTPYYVVVDGYSSNYSGAYTFTVTEGACDAQTLEDGCEGPLNATEGTRTGSNEDSGVVHTGSCGGADGAEAVFALTVDTDTTVCADSNGTSYDTVMYVREAACGNGVEIACDDDGGDVLESQVEFQATAGSTYYLFLDAYDERGSGDYTLNLAFDNCP